MTTTTVNNIADQNSVASHVDPVGKPAAETGPPKRVGLQRIRKIKQGVLFSLFKMAAAVNGIALLIIVYFMVSRGWRAINWTFLTQPPMDSMTKGGILPCIVGTICLSLGAIAVAFPIGIASAVYLNEYARPGRVLRMIRLGINNLAGVPSISQTRFAGSSL